MYSHRKHVAAIEDCAHACQHCQDACLRLIPHCLDLGGNLALPSHIGLLMDSAVICGAAHNLLHRASPCHRRPAGRARPSAAPAPRRASG